METLVVAKPAYDIRSRAHAAGNDAHVAFTRAYSAFARHENFLSIMFFNDHIVMMAVHHFFDDFKLKQFPGSLERADKVLHHERTVGHREVLRPMNRFDVIVK